MDNLSRREGHDVFETHLNESGCLWGQRHIDIVKAAVDYVEKRFDSKFTSAESAAQSAIQLTREVKEELSKVESIARDAVTCTHSASAAVQKSVEENRAFGHELYAKFDQFTSMVNSEFRGMWLKTVAPAALLAAVVVILKIAKII